MKADRRAGGFMDFRTDGLLRGSRGQRSNAMLAVGKAEWDLGRFLDLHCGLLDHAQDVRMAAMRALYKIAKQNPEPISLTPVQLLSWFMFSFTASSGIALDTFEFLVELDTPEARQAIDKILLRTQRNEDFKDFVAVLLRANKLDVLRRLETAKLPKTKAGVVHSALGSAQGTGR
jgi:hypothetical protein